MWQNHHVNHRRMSHKGDRALVPSAVSAEGPRTLLQDPVSCGLLQERWPLMTTAEGPGSSPSRGSHSNVWTHPPTHSLKQPRSVVNKLQSVAMSASPWSLHWGPGAAEAGEQSWMTKTTEMFSLPVLEARSLKSRCHQGPWTRGLSASPSPWWPQVVLSLGPSLQPLLHPLCVRFNLPLPFSRKDTCGDTWAHLGNPE